ncbi:MAG: hypothetical protein QOK28_1257 [Actinomycetota bacterium]
MNVAINWLGSRKALASAVALLLVFGVAVVWIDHVASGGPGHERARSAAPTYRSVVMTDTPISYWRFGESSGTTAADEQGINAGVVGGGTVTEGVPGAVPGSDKAMRFDGGRVYTGTASSLNPNNFTIEAWFKIKDGWTGYGLIYRWRTFGQIVGVSNGVVSASVYGASGAGYGITAPSSSRDGKWHHLAFTKDSSQIKLYIDGALIGTQAMTEPPRYGFDDVYPDTTGAAWGWDGNYYANPNPYYGDLDEVAIYNHALSASRVLAHVAAGGLSVPRGQTFGPCTRKNRNCTTVRRADPVDTATGAFVHEATDTAVPAPGVPFTFTRSYTSGDTTSGPLGAGWTHSYNASLATTATNATFRAEDGAQLGFTLQPDGSYVSDPGVLSTLKSVAGGYTVTRLDGVVYAFDTNGILTNIRDLTGKGVTLAHASGLLSSATDAAGRTATFTYSSGLLTRLALSDGRHIDYTYTAGQLTGVTDVRGKTTTYRYDTAGRLDKETDPNGHTVVENVYDANGRVTDQYDPLGKHTTFAWDPATQTSTMTDAVGATWIDHYDDNVIIDSVEPSGTTTVTHDANVNPSILTDKRGFVCAATYDDAGNLLALTAPASVGGFTQTWVYDSKNNPTSYTDGRGNTTTYAYDSAGRLITTTLPGSVTQTITYDSAGNVATATDADGHTTTYTYDAAGDRTSATTAGGNKTTYAYDTAGRVLTTVDPRGNATGASPANFTTTYTYDAGGHGLTATDPLGETTTHTYDAAGNLASTTDPLGKTTTYAYDAANELIVTRAPDGSTTQTSYDDRGLVASSTTGEGTVTSYTYDGEGHALAMTDPRGKTWTYGYDANGNQTASTDPLNHTTTTTYDALNRPVTLTDANGHATTYAYDPNSNRTAVTDARGQTTTYAYNALNRLTSVTNPLGKTTTYAYDNAGNQLSITSPLGNKTTSAYDADNRLVNQDDPLGNASGGNPAAHRTTYGYDAAGNQTAVTDPLHILTNSTFDAAGRLTSRTTDANLLKHTTSYTYDNLGRLATVTSPDGAVTAYGYDVVGNLTSRTDANHHITTYTYDKDQHLTGLTNALGNHWTYTYDAAGNRVTTADAIANAAANPALGTTTATYDNAGRLTGIDYSDTTPDVSYTYDNVGNRIGMSDGAGTESRTYDNANHLKSVTRGANTISYAYDAAGQLIGRNYFGLRATSLDYDADGRLVAATAAGEPTTYTYDPAGQLLTTSLPNGYIATNTWDAAGHQTSVTNAKDGAILSSFQYRVGNEGDPLDITTPNGIDTFNRDAAGRLTEDCHAASCAVYSPDLTKWTYDGVGNRLTESVGAATTTYTYNAADEMTGWGVAGQSLTTATYDADGRQTTAGPVTSYRYDMAGHLHSATLAGGVTTAYGYDGDGNRVTTETGTVPTSQLWDTNLPVPQLAAEETPLGVTLRDYTYGLRRISVRDTTTRAESYYLTDRLGSVANITDANANTQWTYSYSPFGKTTSATQGTTIAPQLNTTALPNQMRFNGEQLDLTTHLYDLRARDYNPATGRLTTTDPLSPPLDDPYVAAYVYASDRPTVETDPSGERPTGPHKSAVAIPSGLPVDGWQSLRGAPLALREGGSLVGDIAGGALAGIALDVILAEPAGGADDEVMTYCTYCENHPAYLFRGGSSSNTNLTPRLGKDTDGWPQNGLSTYFNPARACRGQSKVQILSVDRLHVVPGLMLQNDYADLDHVFLEGATKQTHLEWARSRDNAASNPHALTVGAVASVAGQQFCQ